MGLNEEPWEIALSTFSFYRKLTELWDIVLRSKNMESAREWPVSSGEALIDCSVDRESDMVRYDPVE